MAIAASTFWQPDRILRPCKRFHSQTEVREDLLDYRRLVNLGKAKLWQDDETSFLAMRLA